MTHILDYSSSYFYSSSAHHPLNAFNEKITQTAIITTYYVWRSRWCGRGLWEGEAAELLQRGQVGDENEVCKSESVF